MRQIKRCAWVTDDPLYITYHDEEWGIPSYDDQYLFEMLTLEGAQAGLSWLTILKKRENYRELFANFDPEEVSTFNESRLASILQNDGIIRNKLKVKSVVTNAQAFLKIQKEYGSFAEYIWSFVQGKPIINDWKEAKQVPASTKLSTEISKDLKRHGFKFIGPVICYAYMQAIGMVNDHSGNCDFKTDLA